MRGTLTMFLHVSIVLADVNINCLIVYLVGINFCCKLL